MHFLDTPQNEAQRNTPQWASVPSKIETLRKRLKTAAKKQKKYADKRRKVPPTFQVNDWVLLDADCFGRYRPCKKLDNRFWGPYRVTEALGNDVYRLELPAGMRTHNTFHVSKLEKVQTRPPELGHETEHQEVGELGSGIDEVLKVTGERTRDGKKEFRVVWAGTIPELTTWEPKENLLHARASVREFRRRNRAGLRREEG